jgi:transcriptional regulator with XRE-family HTH domain
MTSRQFFNHLKKHRRRLGLSQAELAYLLGVGSGTKICRYERFLLEPKLRTVLAYEILFQKPARELFAGLYVEIEAQVRRRAALLGQQNARGKPKPKGCKGITSKKS